MSNFLEARGVSKAYRNGSRRVDVLDELDLSVEAGDAVAIVGDSGVGKSTLLHLLGGLDRPDAGQVTVDGQDLFGGGEGRLRSYRNRDVGFVFQFHHLLPEFTARENVEMPFRIGRIPFPSNPSIDDLLGKLGLAERITHYPSELSGGEQQRVAIARAVAASPRLILADEPTGNLDPRTGDKVFDLLGGLQQERGFALVLATHSERLARKCRHVYRMVEGRLTALDAGKMSEFFATVGADTDRDPML